MRVAAVGAAVPAAIAEGVELLDIADRRAGLLRHPGAQADFEGAVVDGVERAGRQRGRRRAGRGAGDQDQRRVAAQRDNGGGEADFDGDGRARLVHGSRPDDGVTADRAIHAHASS